MFITKNTNKDLKDLKSNDKYYSISFSANTIDFKLLNSLIPYYKVRKVIYKGKNTDSLFIRVSGIGKNLIKLFNRYNKVLKGLTYQETSLLKNIREKSYISKKYNFYDDVLDNEYGYYEPIIQTDTYNDYDNCYNQSIFKNKRIDYNKKDNIKKDAISKTLERACKLITDFKLSNTSIKINSDTLFEDIFNYRVKVCSFKLHNNYHRVKNNYDSYEEFIKYVVFYGANHHSNQRFWQKTKKELY